VAGVPWSEPLPQQGLVAWSAIDMDTYVSAYVVFRVVTLNPDVTLRQVVAIINSIPINITVLLNNIPV
jgi:hypothetical protein